MSNHTIREKETNMTTIDRQPVNRKPIEIAADLARQSGDSLSQQGAAAIRDLIELSRAFEKLCTSYRIGGMPGKALDTIARHKWMIE